MIAGTSLLVLCLGVFGLAASASAQSEYGQELGAYLAVQGGYSLNTSTGSIGRETRRNAGLVAARAGIRLGPNAAFELQGDWNSGTATQIDSFVATTNFRFYYVDEALLDFALQPFVVLGAGVAGGEPKKEHDYRLNGAFRMGGGVDLYLTEKMAVGVVSEWVTSVGALSDLSYAVFGMSLQYNF